VGAVVVLVVLAVRVRLLAALVGFLRLRQTVLQVKV
jgi:hypothetical protein